jgi:tetratricopeptide (TPR) repeat protein
MKTDHLQRTLCLFYLIVSIDVFAKPDAQETVCTEAINQWLITETGYTSAQKEDIRRLLSRNTMDETPAEIVRSLIEFGIASNNPDHLSACIQFFKGKTNPFSPNYLEAVIGEIEYLTRRAQYNGADSLVQSLPLTLPLEYLYRVRLAATTYLTETGRTSEAAEGLLDLLNNGPPTFMEDHRFGILWHLANMYYNVQEWSTALKYFEEAVLLTEPGTPVWINAKNAIASVLSRQQKLSEAVEIWIQLRENAHSQQDTLIFLQTTLNIGNIFNKSGDYDKAFAEYRIVLDISTNMNLGMGIFMANLNMADAYSDMGDIKNTLDHLGKLFSIPSIELSEEMIRTILSIYGRVGITENTEITENIDILFKEYELAQASHANSKLLLSKIETLIRAIHQNEVENDKEISDFTYYAVLLLITIFLITAIFVWNREKIIIENNSTQNEDKYEDQLQTLFSPDKLFYKQLQDYYANRSYIDVTTSIERFAVDYDLSVYKARKIIHDAGYQNFYDMVSRMRLYSLLSALKDDPQRNITDADCERLGFVNKRAFTRALKTYTGKTFEEYLATRSTS